MQKKSTTYQNTTVKFDNVFWNTLSSMLLFLCLFFAPSNLFLKLQPNAGYVQALQIDYLIPKLHLSFLVAVLFLSIKAVNNLRPRWKSIKPQLVQPSRLNVLATCYLLLTTFVLRQLFVPFPVTAVWTVMNLIVFTLFYQQAKSFVSQLSVAKKQILIWMLYGTLLFQSCLGIYQFFTQRSLTGFIPLGEVTLRNQPYLARGDFYLFDQFLSTHLGQRILPYGTTPHPNILAGFLAIGAVILLKKLSVRFVVKLFLLCPVFLCLLLTQSISAFATFFLGLIVVGTKRIMLQNQKLLLFCVLGIIILVPLLLGTWNVKLGISSATSFSRRVFLNQAGLKMWLQHPIFGIGLNQFTAELENIQPSTEVVSFIQPAHHVGILFLAENGILGVLLILLIFQKLKDESRRLLLVTCLLLLPILTLDHYLYTLIQGWWIFIIVLLFLDKDIHRTTGSDKHFFTKP